MRQSKKVFTRMVINNWGGISHKLMEFHEYVNLFSGKSGSGKSTVMDALQVVLYGSTKATFLNKAADDAKNRRSVFSYLRGAQKDGSANRQGMDFCSQLVLEIWDTGSDTYTCIGVSFQVGKQDRELSDAKYSFFSHSGKIPEDEYLDVNGRPYTLANIQKHVKERGNSPDNKGRGEVNKVYLTNRDYLGTLYELILGHMDPGRFITMEKSAIALRMSNGTGQFIKDYMFPRSKEDTVSTISDQLGAYREIKERVEDLEHRIDLLSEVKLENQALMEAQADKLRTEALLRILDIEGTKARLASKKGQRESILDKIAELEKKQEILDQEKNVRSEDLIEVKAELQSSNFGAKKKELENLERTISQARINAGQWKEILEGLEKWTTDEEIGGYISNPTLQAMEDLLEGQVTEEGIEKIKKGFSLAMESIEEELSDLGVSIREKTKDLKEKKEMVEDLKNDRKPYKKELKSARAELQRELSNRYGRSIPVYIFGDLFDISDEKWKNAIEGRLGRLKHSLITEPRYALDAAGVFRSMKRREYEEIDLINTAAILRDQPEANEGTLYEAVSTKEAYVDQCLKRYLGRIKKCDSIEELHEVKEGVTADCYSYSNYIFRHLREVDYTRYACIGTRVSRGKLQEVEDEIMDLETSLLSDNQGKALLSGAKKMEQLRQSTKTLLELASASESLDEYLKQEEKIKAEIKELQEGVRTKELHKKREKLEGELSRLGGDINKVQRSLVRESENKGRVEKEERELKDRLAYLKEGQAENPELQKEVEESLKNLNEQTYRAGLNKKLETLSKKEETALEKRNTARIHFNNEYPSYGYSGLEHDNARYDKLLSQYQKDFEPQYKEEFEKQYKLVYHSLRENVIATIHGEIKAAYRHRKEINRMLSKIRFSDSTYQIDILPAENENGQFYDMLMAEELDSKVLDNDGFEGQLSLGEDLFYQKYEKQISLLTEKFMPPREEDGERRRLHKEEMEKYADYRNYLTFSMYERVEDELGNVKKNSVDDMAGRDSGGEGQNPKYVALLAGFAMLYMQQGSGDSKIRLVLLDEAFSKMDKERSEVCLRYARELDLQLIVCVPDERLQSLIRNVDSVYGFRRHKNQISMMHIDKGSYLEMMEG